MTFEFSTAQFVFSHGHPPRGRGCWAFAVKALGGEPIFAPFMSFAEAKAWLRDRIRTEVPGDFTGTVMVQVLP